MRLDDLIGKTPIIKLSELDNVFVKLESYNPTGSIKDRVAKFIIEEYEKNNTLNKESEIVIATSGNMGISLAFICSIKNYKCSVFMGRNASFERKKLIKYYGANLYEVDSLEEAIEMSIEYAKKDINRVLINQFENTLNPLAHYLTTGNEILLELNGDIDYFVSGIGSGGTISGVAKKLKDFNPKIRVVGVLPVFHNNKHNIEGIGAGFKPKTLEEKYIDDIYEVEYIDALNMVNELGKKEGLSVGLSSGAAYYVAKHIAEINKDKRIVVIFPDGIDKYLSIIK